MTRILVADDHVLLRDSIARLLDAVPGFEVVGRAADGAEAVALAAELEPDVVLMDIEMPQLDGIAATAHIAQVRPGTPVVMLSSYGRRDDVLGALDAGASGYLLKDAEPEDIVRAVRAAMAGDAPLAPRAASALIAERTRPQPAAALSEREREVLELVAAGLPNKLIARRLGISQRTVKGHLTHVFRQIGVTDRTQAALWAIEHGIARNDKLPGWPTTTSSSSGRPATPAR
jgi:DNA-binding NarL/FixJ family response regulator